MRIQLVIVAVVGLAVGLVAGVLIVGRQLAAVRAERDEYAAKYRRLELKTRTHTDTIEYLPNDGTLDSQPRANTATIQAVNQRPHAFVQERDELRRSAQGTPVKEAPPVPKTP